MVGVAAKQSKKAMNRQLMTPHSASLANANVNDSHFKKSKISSQQFTVIFLFSNFYLEGKKTSERCRLPLVVIVVVVAWKRCFNGGGRNVGRVCVFKGGGGWEG